MKIAILDDYQNVVSRLPCFDLLKEHEIKIFNSSATGLGQLAIRLAPFDVLVLIGERTVLSKALLHKLSNLKFISQIGSVTSHIDLLAADEMGIIVSKGFADPTAPAELTWALILAASRQTTPYATNMKEGLWQTVSLHPERNILGRVLKGRTLGIWGYGNIGKIVAGYGKAFGMQVIIWGSDTSCAQAKLDGYEVALSKKSFFVDSDVISVHLLLNKFTIAIITETDLNLMKPDALFVNTSRAALVESGALEKALAAGRPGFAALDVFETEPLRVQHPLLHLENVSSTPHLGYVEQDSYELYFRAAFQNIINYSNNISNT
jgi:D-3-phosphoglycerate dehydrogenase